MKIEDKGIILSQKTLQESMLLLKILSKNHGICSGLAKHVKGKKVYDYQVGNIVQFERFSRLDDQLGVLKCERLHSYQGSIILERLKLYSFKNLTNIILTSFKEYENCELIYDKMLGFLNNLSQISWLNYCNFEIDILREAGYGLELESCAVLGVDAELTFVSPKSGKAVSNPAASGYEHLLLKFPEFLYRQTEPVDSAEILQALDLTEYFFKRYIWSEKNIGQTMEDREKLRDALFGITLS